ncbi:MAG: hypothetical protein NWE93_11685 [Candidatus Bathyarchaeota archaeon]|nr:hypothetical protein [Candidatus Bathyarchaeota archaeon]
MIHKVVYYDELFESGWVNLSVAKEIANYLSGKGFTIVNAVQLKDLMVSTLKGEVINPVVVFAMDKAPYTIMDSTDANCLVRQFLDRGARIVWIGDIPFWNIAVENDKKESLNKEESQRIEAYYQMGAHMSLLGVNPVIRTSSLEMVNITKQGKNFRLSHKWSGVRPVEVSTGVRLKSNLGNSKLAIRGSAFQNAPFLTFQKDRGLMILAKSAYMTGRPIILLERKRIPIKAELSLSPKIDLDYPENTEEVKPEKNEFWGVYANAWFKNFNRSRPFSGFLRLWDCNIKVITDEMLKELHNISLTGY